MIAAMHPLRWTISAMTIATSAILFAALGNAPSTSDLAPTIATIEKLKLATDATNYGERMIENLDLVCIDHSNELQALTQKEMIEMLEGDTLSDDGKFLLAASWLRMHPEADASTYKAFSSPVRKPFHSFAVPMRFEECEGMSQALNFDSVSFPSTKGSFPHGFIFARKTESKVAGVQTFINTGPNRCRSFWYISEFLPGKKPYFLHRIERAWPAKE